MKYIRTLISFSFLLFFFSFIPGAFAEEGQTYEVGIPALNARSAPSHSSDVVGILSQGDRVVSFQEKHGWLMTYYGGQEVWVASHFLFPLKDNSGLPGNEAQPQAQGSNIQSEQDHITVHTGGVRIRSGAGTNYPVIGSVQEGKSYVLIDTVGEWHQIALGNGSAGWIASWLTDSPTGTPQANELSETAPADDVQIKAKEDLSGGLAGKTIVLDPGHGGKDPGSIGLNGLQEKDVIMDITNQVAGQLRNAGANVVFTRSGDYFIPLGQRVNISHTNDADAFISLHYNAFPVISVQGINTYYYDDGSHELASNVHASLAQNVSLKDRGVRQENFHVLRENSNPAALLELGFITNPDDLLQIQTADYQNGVAAGIANGLQQYFN